MRDERPARKDPTLARALTAIAAINRGRQPAVPDLFARVREVVVIASSSRGGSSIFTEILRQSPGLIHCKGEINPFLAIAGLSFPESGREDDSLDEGEAGPHNRHKLAVLEQELALDLGVNGPHPLATDSQRQRFGHDLWWRITSQWPEIEIDGAFLLSSVDATFAELGQKHGWQAGEFRDPQLFHILFLKRLRSRYPKINPHYYDLNPELIGRYCPEAAICQAPPVGAVTGVVTGVVTGAVAGALIEEPPFVLIVPRQAVTPGQLTHAPLILKTPSNVYRLAFLRRIFAKARFRVLHLTRNPADSINGLVDGWQYHGFFSHRLPGRLAIKGYSDRFPEWGTSWWKYDLPPGWQGWVDEPLEYLCGFQWRSAHQAILSFLEQTGVESLRIPFEEVIGTMAMREQRFTEIADWLGVDRGPLITAATGELPLVMATARPRQRRWFKRAGLLRPVLSDPRIIETAQRLGYDTTYDCIE